MNRMKERAMRWVSAILLILLLILGMASPALAADYDLPILRGSSQPPAPVVTVGPATFTRWSGFYFGGNVSLGSATSDFSTATRPLVAVQLAAHDGRRPVIILRIFRSSAEEALLQPAAAPFLGYNTQWQDLILGVEATYTHVNLNTTASSVPHGVGRFFPDVNTAVNVSASGNLDLTDYGTARGRAGYVIGNFLPYGFVGMAVGRASYSVTTLADVTQTSNKCPIFVRQTW